MTCRFCGIGIAWLLVVWASGPASGADAPDEAYLRYVHPTIRQPFPDLLDLRIPPELGDCPLAALGLVDVTKSPFGADPSGEQDSTAAIQAAVTLARDHQMVCFFPPGTYRVSDTIECVQQLYRRANGRVFGGNRFPNLLVGSRVGAERPKLLLAPNSSGFGDPARPKIFVHFWSRGYLNPTTADRVSDGLSPEVEQPNIGMNQMLLFGHGGNAKGMPDYTLYLIERTPNFLLANGVDGPTKIGSRSLSHPDGSTDPRRWHLLIDRPDGTSERKLPPGERPVLYQRGRPRTSADEP